MGKVETYSLNETKPMNDVTNNITFDTLLDTQFLRLKSIRLLNYNHR